MHDGRGPPPVSGQPGSLLPRAAREQVTEPRASHPHPRRFKLQAVYSAWDGTGHTADTQQTVPAAAGRALVAGGGQRVHSQQLTEQMKTLGDCQHRPTGRVIKEPKIGIQYEKENRGRQS